MVESNNRPDIDNLLENELFKPLEEHRDVNFGAVESELTAVFLLGSVVRLGLRVRGTGDGNVEIAEGLVSDQPNSRKVTLLTPIRDLTPEYASDFFTSSKPAPSPLAIQFSDSTVYTTDSRNPKDSLLGFRYERGSVFDARLRRGDLQAMQVTVIESIVKNTALVRRIGVSYRAGRPREMVVTHYLSESDPVLEASMRVYSRLRRYKGISDLQIPLLKLAEYVLDNEKRMIRDSVVELANLLGSSMEGEEITSILNVIDSESAEAILTKVFEAAGKRDQVMPILNMVKEGINPAKRHGFESRFLILGDDNIELRSTENFGKTTALVSNWRQFIERFNHESSAQWLFGFREIGGRLRLEIDNLSAVVSGNIEIEDREF